MNTIQLSITSGEPDQELLIGYLSELGATGFEQKEDVLLAYFPELDFNSYEVNGVVKDYPHSIQTLEEKNWNEVWESNFSPVIVNDFCAVRAGFHDPAEGVEHEIIITPKMSFGTGHHATTYMMMNQMRRMDFKAKTVFDFGTGTGILAILAEKLGAADITAIDVDEWSITNTIENLERNGCTRIKPALTTELPEKKFDIILANINRNVIVDYLPGLEKIVSKEGLVLFSGLLVSDGPEIINRSAHWLQLIHKEERENWLSILFKKL